MANSSILAFPAGGCSVLSEVSRQLHHIWGYTSPNIVEQQVVGIPSVEILSLRARGIPSREGTEALLPGCACWVLAAASKASFGVKKAHMRLAREDSAAAR